MTARALNSCFFLKDQKEYMIVFTWAADDYTVATVASPYTYAVHTYSPGPLSQSFWFWLTFWWTAKNWTLKWTTLNACDTQSYGKRILFQLCYCSLYEALLLSRMSSIILNQTLMRHVSSAVLPYFLSSGQGLSADMWVLDICQSWTKKLCGDMIGDEIKLLKYSKCVVLLFHCLVVQPW